MLYLGALTTWLLSAVTPYGKAAALAQPVDVDTSLHQTGERMQSFLQGGGSTTPLTSTKPFVSWQGGTERSKVKGELARHDRKPAGKKQKAQNLVAQDIYEAGLGGGEGKDHAACDVSTGHHALICKAPHKLVADDLTCVSQRLARGPPAGVASFFLDFNLEREPSALNRLTRICSAFLRKTIASTRALAFCNPAKLRIPSLANADLRSAPGSMQRATSWLEGNNSTRNLTRGFFLNDRSRIDRTERRRN